MTAGSVGPCAFLLSILVVVAALSLEGCAVDDGCVGGTPSLEASPPVDLRERWGISLEPVRLTAGGHLIDFRYRVLDGDKAAPLSDSATKPLLVHKPTGAQLSVPYSTRVGALRQTTRNGKVPIAGRTYFVLFSNPGGSITSGSEVAVVIGDFKADNLLVQ